LHRLLSGQAAVASLEVTVVRDGRLAERTVKPR
jgi:hypothetical protein